MTDFGDADVCQYSPRSIPAIFFAPGYRVPDRCGCVRTASVPQVPTGPPQRFEFSFSYNPPWDEQASLQERRKEECRRISWAALNLIANYTAQRVAFHQEPMELNLMESSNVSTPLVACASCGVPDFFVCGVKFVILFPGEAYERKPANCIPGQSPKDSVWALYCRSMLLWTSCVRERDTSWTTEERANFAIQGWTELNAVQEALNMHQCNLDTSLMYLIRDYLHKWVTSFLVAVVTFVLNLSSLALA